MFRLKLTYSLLPRARRELAALPRSRSNRGNALSDFRIDRRSGVWYKYSWY